MIEWTKDKNGALLSVDAHTKKPVGVAHLADGRDGLTVDGLVDAFNTIITQEDSKYLAQAQEQTLETDSSR